MRQAAFFIIASIAYIFIGCDQFPKDSSHTLKKVENKTLKVGLSAYDTSAKARLHNTNDEIRLVQAFAKSLNAKVNWVKGSQTDIINLLQHQEVDMAIGGYTSPSPFEKEVSFSKPYQTINIKLGAPGNQEIPVNIKGKKVWVNNLLTALYVKQKGGVAVLSDSLPRNQLVAATEDELRKLQLKMSDIAIHQQKLVIAIPKGENAFLMKLEKFIDEYRKSKKDI